MMSSGREIRKRSERVAQLQLPPGHLEQVFRFFKNGEVLSRIAIAFLATLVMWTATSAWRPAFPFRMNQVPSRDIVARLTFKKEDPAQTQEARQKARRESLLVYRHDPKLLVELRQGLKDKVHQIISAKDYNPDEQLVWQDFLFPVADDSGEKTPIDPASEWAQEQFRKFQAYFRDDPSLERFERKIANAFDPLESRGLLVSLQHELEEGLQTEITILKPNGERSRVSVSDVRLAMVTEKIKIGIVEELGSTEMASHLFAWLEPRFPETLKKDDAESSKAADLAASLVDDVFVTYEAGRDVLAKAGEPLTVKQLRLLSAEYEEQIKTAQWLPTLARVFASLGMYFALYVLCGAYLIYRHYDLLKNLRRFVMLQALVVTTVILARVVAEDAWQLELVPLMLFGMTAAIAYRQEVALLLTAAVSLVGILSLGEGLPEFVVWTATLAATILLLRDVRSRTKLIYIGLAASLVAFLTALGVGIVSGQDCSLQLLKLASWYALLTAISGVLMTGILPFIESLFDVQTEISLLELGDIAHPLLQELVRRAPGTYNHSINVASIAEAAADSIGANGLLLRVGAYFHDIGKMLKPQYFIENQGADINRHETLLPAMSTLIIIAHVKDGADLARQHHLPQPLIDLIVQHHGTTLVEYFFSRASKQSESDPDASHVDEGSYRYPGPRPQTREAAVLMLADAVESASRSLKEPAPARIESLVHEIAMKRLLDGQFDECGLTLQDLRTVEDSLVKSLTAVYHGRVKYPDQQSA